MRTKKIAVCGYLANGQSILSGQVIKTRIVSSELCKELSDDEVYQIDTAGIKKIFLMFFRIIFALFTCRNIAIFPAENALPIVSIWVRIWNCLFHRGLHYVVIGGWLPEFLDNHKFTSIALKSYRGIYVETYNMKKALEKRGFCNVIVMPNCKHLDILEEIPDLNQDSVRLVTFSRIMKEKGIEYAIEAVSNANEKIGYDLFYLDIYGQEDPLQKEWFEEVKSKMPSYVKYGGLIPFGESTKVLRNYHILLFPTYYEGEGFAGTLIDGFAAGLPSVASDWRYNTEIVKDHINGLVVPVHDVVSLTNSILWINEHKEEWYKIRHNCLIEAQNYLPSNVVPILVNNLK